MDILGYLRQQLGSDPMIGGMAALVGQTASGARTFAEDALWSVSNPIDRLMGRGRAAEGEMMIPVAPGGFGGSSFFLKGGGFRMGPARTAMEQAIRQKALTRLRLEPTLEQIQQAPVRPYDTTQFLDRAYSNHYRYGRESLQEGLRNSQQQQFRAGLTDIESLRHPGEQIPNEWMGMEAQAKNMDRLTETLHRSPYTGGPQGFKDLIEQTRQHFADELLRKAETNSYPLQQRYLANDAMDLFTNRPGADLNMRFNTWNPMERIEAARINAFLQRHNR